MIDSSQPGASATLSDPGGYGTAAQDAAVLADVQEAMQVWASHLDGLGTLTVQVTMVDEGQDGVLANGAPTLDVVEGTLDGHRLLESGAVYELATGQHLDGGTDITINVNAAYLDQIYLGGGTAAPASEYDGLSLFEHEIEHGLGFGGETNGSGTLNATYETMWDHYLADQDGTEVFTGPNAMAVNGGPVDVTTLANGEGYAHLANSYSDPNADDLMSGLGLPTGVSRPISSVDLAILADVGAPITGIAGSVTVAGTGNSATVGQAQTLTGITLADTGALTSSTVTLIVSDAAGRIVPGSMATGVGIDTAADMSTLTITGSLAQVQAQVADLSYTSAAAGSEVVTLTVLDSYGNSGSGTMVVSSVPVVEPVASSVTAIADAAGPLGRGHSVTFTVATTGPVTVGPNGTLCLTLSDGGTASYDAGVSTATSLMFTTTVAAGQDAMNLTVTGLALEDGATLTGGDGADITLDLSSGTGGAASGIVVDTTAPLAPAVFVGASQGPAVLTGQTEPTIAGTAEAGSTVTLYDGITVLGTTVAAGGTWSFAVTSPLADGVHGISATATDAAGNVSLGTTLALTVDTTAPLAPILVLASNPVSTDATGVHTDAAMATLSGLSETGSTISLYEDGSLVGSAVASSTGSWSVSPASALASGTNTITATATDAAGNVSDATTLIVVLDAPAPVTPVTSTTPVSTIPTGVTLAVKTASATAGTTVTSITPPVAGTASSPPMSTVVTLSAATQASFTADAGSSVVIGDGGATHVFGNASGSSTMTLFGSSGAASYDNGGGTAIVVDDGASSFALTGGTTGSTMVVFAGGALTTYAGDSGADEIIGGTGSLDLTGGTGGSLLVFGGTGSMRLVSGGEQDLVVGGAGAATIHAGAGGVFAGSGGSRLYANGSGTFLAGNVSGDQLTASSVGGDILAAGSGNETLDGGASANANLVFGGTGQTQITLGAGADTFVAGSGASTVQAGSGNAQVFVADGAGDTLSFVAGHTGGTDLVSGFRVGTDHLQLSGYASGPTATTAGGNTTLRLSDGTHVVLVGVSDFTGA